MSRAFRDLIVSWEIINTLFFVTAYMHGEKTFNFSDNEKKYITSEKKS